MADLIIPEPPFFSNGWMSLFPCEINNFYTYPKDFSGKILERIK
jgi:hypothetical protein